MEIHITVSIGKQPTTTIRRCTQPKWPHVTLVPVPNEVLGKIVNNMLLLKRTKGILKVLPSGEDEPAPDEALGSFKHSQVDRC